MTGRLAITLLSAALLGAGGCNSFDVQQRRFVDAKNAEIGQPFYAQEAKSTREVKLSPTESEFVPDPTPACGVAWTVDTRLRGQYHQPNGMTFEIEGIKKSWRLVGDPNRALMRFNWTDW